MATFLPLDFLRAIRASALSGHAKSVAVWIASYASNEDVPKPGQPALLEKRAGEAFPALDTLVSASGFSRATVSRAIAECETGGWLTRSRASRTASTHYQLPLDATPLLATSQVATSQGDPCDASTRAVRRLHQSRATPPIEALSASPSADSSAQVSDPVAGAPEPLSLKPTSGAERKPKKAKAAKPDIPGHADVIAAYDQEYEKLRGEKPIIDGKQGKGAKELLATTKSAGAAIAVIRRAFTESDFVRKHPDLMFIARNVNDFRGTIPVKATSAKHLMQPVPAAGRAWHMGGT